MMHSKETGYVSLMKRQSFLAFMSKTAVISATPFNSAFIRRECTQMTLCLYAITDPHSFYIRSSDKK